MSDRSEVERYKGGELLLRQAVVGLTREQLQTMPADGSWSIKQIVVHLIDSDAVSIERMKRVIAMDTPLLLGFDESAFVAKLAPHTLGLEECLQLFELNRRLMSQILHGLADEAFERFGVHNLRGKVTLAELVKGTNDHVDHHLKFVVKKRELVGAAAE